MGGGDGHTHTHESPESLTSQSQMPQLSHQYRGVKRRQLPRSTELLCAVYNVRINMHQEGQRQELLLPPFCENMCVRHRSLAARQEAAQSAGRVSLASLKSAPLLPSPPPAIVRRHTHKKGALTCDAPARNATVRAPLEPTQAPPHLLPGPRDGSSPLAAHRVHCGCSARPPFSLPPPSSAPSTPPSPLDLSL